MKTQTFVKRTRLAAPAGEVFAWHARPGALERLTPPWTRTKVLERTGGVEDGARVTIQTRLGPLPVRWIAEHRDYQEGVQFRDVQIAGPFARWEHTHRVDPDGPEACALEDRIEYALPLGSLGRLVGETHTQRALERVFAYRHRMTSHDIADHRQHQAAVPMNLLVTGSSGLIGPALVAFLTTGGHRVTRLLRSQPRPGQSAVEWTPDTGKLDVTRLEGYDAVIHLDGGNITPRWTLEKKTRTRDSRVSGTRLLCASLGRLDKPPKVLVCASAMAYDGDRGYEILTEDRPPGRGSPASVCQDWEAAAAPAVRRRIRVVHLRLGVVLSPAGGTPAKLLWLFRLGLGAIVGSGHQSLSWIAVDDAVGTIYHALMTDGLHGPINAVAPHALSNEAFTKTLGRVLGRPTPLQVPAPVARLLFGGVAAELLLASALVEPSQLLASGYAFRFPTLEGALRHVLGR